MTPLRSGVPRRTGAVVSSGPRRREVELWSASRAHPWSIGNRNVACAAHWVDDGYHKPGRRTARSGTVERGARETVTALAAPGGCLAQWTGCRLSPNLSAMVVGAASMSSERPRFIGTTYWLDLVGLGPRRYSPWTARAVVRCPCDDNRRMISKNHLCRDHTFSAVSIG
jgi:hypothetical protein